MQTKINNEILRNSTMLFMNTIYYSFDNYLSGRE